MEYHKVPRGILTPPPYAWGFSGAECLILVGVFVVGCMLVMSIHGPVKVLIGMLVAIGLGVLYLFFKMSHRMRRCFLKHYMVYVADRVIRLQRFCGRDRTRDED